MLLTQVVVSACPARGASGAAAGAAVGTLTAATHSGRCPIGTRAAAELRVQICRPPGHNFNACIASNDFNGFNQTAAVAVVAVVAAAVAVVAVAAVAAAAAVFVVGVVAAIVIPSVVPYVHNFAYVCPHRCIPDLAAEHACWPRRILRGRLGSWGGILGVGFVARRIA